MKSLALFAALAVAFTLACGADKDDYVRENERILEELPVFPGAVVERLTSNPYDEPEGSGAPPYEVIGYTTNVVYEAPPDATAQQVIDFYAERLAGGWEVRFEEIPIVVGGTGERRGTVLIAHFMRGEAIVSVNTDGIVAAAAGRTFEVVVDQRGNRDR